MGVVGKAPRDGDRQREVRERVREVFLRQTGDWERDNRSPAAVRLAAWLDSLPDRPVPPTATIDELAVGQRFVVFRFFRLIKPAPEQNAISGCAGGRPD